MMAPATLGPTRRAALNMDELSAMALPRSRLSSISVTTNACRPGMSNAFTIPWNTLTAISHGMEIVFDRVNAARTNEMTIEVVCVATSSR